MGHKARLIILLVLISSSGAFAQVSETKNLYTDSLLVALKQMSQADKNQEWANNLPKLINYKIQGSRIKEFDPYIHQAIDAAQQAHDNACLVKLHGIWVTYYKQFPINDIVRIMDTTVTIFKSLNHYDLDALGNMSIVRHVFVKNRKYTKALVAAKEWARMKRLSHSQEDIFEADMLLSVTYADAGYYEKAKQILYRSINGVGDTSRLFLLHKANSYDMLSNAFSEENKPDSTIWALKEGVKQYRYLYSSDEVALGQRIPSLIQNIVLGYLEQNRLDSAEHYLKEWSRYLNFLDSADWVKRSYYERYATLEYKRGNLQKSFEYLKIAENHLQTYQTTTYSSLLYLQYGTNYLTQGDGKNAVKYFEQGYENAKRNIAAELKSGDIIRFCDTLGYAYRRLGNYEKSAQYYKLSTLYRKQLMEENNIQELARQELKESERAVANLEIERRLRKNAFALASFAGMMLILVLYLLYKRQKLYNALEYEKSRSEALLLNVLPNEIAHRLKGNDKIADAFDEASVIFIDIVGFTSLASTNKPTDIVNMLNEIFTHFDHLTDKLGLEKIKTIGDCYMAVAGIPKPNTNHIEACIQLGMDILNGKQFYYQDHRVQFRIGIETGPVVAGIIGEKRFLYDLWGDVVNTASRMESYGVPNAIHTTDNVYQKVKDLYRFEDRGYMHIKGKGEIQTWLIHSENK